MADELSRGKRYAPPRLPSDGALAAGQQEACRGRGQRILAPALIPSLREILSYGVPASVVCKFAEAVGQTLTRMPAEELASRLESLGKVMEIEVRRPRPPVGK